MATDAALLKQAQAYIDRFNERVAALFGVAPVKVKAMLAGTDGAIVLGGPGQVFINPRTWDPSNVGAIIFELTRSYGVNTDSAEDVAMADAVRYLVAGDRAGRGDEGWDLSPQARTIVDQYQRANGGSSAGPRGDNPNNPDLTHINELQAAYGTEGGTGDNSWEVDTTGGKGGDGDKAEQARKDNRAYYYNYIQDLGIGVTGNITQLVHEALNKGWNTERFTYYLRQTPEYRQEYRGIFNEDGSLKMTEAEYKALSGQFEDYAAQAGVNMGDGMVGWLMKNDVSAVEFADRVEAKGRLNRDKALYAAFQKELVQGGIASKGEVNRKEMLKFSLGVGNKEWYDLWQDTVTRNAAVEGGINVGRRALYTGLGQGVIERISGKGLSEEAMMAGFEEVADELLNTLPMSEARTYGLTKKDIVKATFGGKNSARSRQKIKRVTDTNEAFSDERAASQVFADQGGTTQVLGRDTQKRAQTY